MTIWLLARAAGLTAFLAFSLATGLGAAGSNLGSSPQTRLLVQYVHRSAAVTGLVMLAAHVSLLVADKYAGVGVAGALIPGAGTYRPAYVALGTIAMYLIVAAAVAGIVRGRLAGSGPMIRWWRPVHLSAYAGWALSAVHFLKSGTDVGQTWAGIVVLSGLAVVAAGVASRLASTTPEIAAQRQSVREVVSR